MLELVRGLGEPRVSERSQGTRVAIALSLVAAAVALFFATCQRTEVIVPHDYEGEARRNPYLAAERMLTRMGMPAKSFDDVGVLESLPPESATIIIPTERQSLEAHTTNALLNWVDAGGNLVVVSWQLWDDKKRSGDPILDPIGVHQFMNKDDDSDEGTDEKISFVPAADDEDDDSDEPPLADAEFPDRDPALELRFDQRFRLELTDDAEKELIVEAGDDAGSHLVTLRHGKGLITALSDDYFMTQPQIGDYDHAEMMYRLTRLGGHRGPVWFVYGDRFPSPWSWLLRNGWMVAASAGVLLFVWLWSAVRRQGPILPDPPAAQRELMEHVRAAGRLEWRRGAAHALLSAVRAALFARMRERHPSFHAAAPSEQVAQLESLSGVPRARIEEALAFRDDRDPSRFVTKVAVLEKLRRSL